jgi:hypothetical protein
MSKFVIREYKDGDEVSIMKLRGLVLSGPKDMDWWQWQHKQNPAGHVSIFIAESEKSHEIVGHNCDLPLRMKVNNEVCQAMTAIDAMVHPDYRGLGIYSRIRQSLDRISQQKEISLRYSWPNQNMLPINLKMGIKPVFKYVPFWIKPMRPANIVNRYFKKNTALTQLLTTLAKGVIKIADMQKSHQIYTQVREVKEIDGRFDTLWQQASSLHEIMMVRDRAYLDWRYVKKPDADYTIYVSEQDDQLLGYIVLRSVEDNGLKVGWIADILTCSRDTLAAMDLITKAIQHFEAKGEDMILCVMPPRAYLAPRLRKCGFFNVSKLRRGKERINCREFTAKYPESFLHNPNNWFLTRGDSDLI